MGNLVPEAHGSISYISIKPWAEVAVPTLEPVAEAEPAAEVEPVAEVEVADKAEAADEQEAEPTDKQEE